MLKSIKKKYPILIIIVLFSGYLIQTGLVRLSTTKAEKITDLDSKKVHYESLFRKQVFEDLDGNKLHYQNIDSPVVVVHFWASWCVPCLKEIPSLKGLQKKYSDQKIKVLAINQDDEQKLKNIKEIDEKHNLDFIHIPDHKQKHVNDFNVVSLPFSLIYGEGKVIHVSTKEEDFLSEEITRKVEKVLRN